MSRCISCCSVSLLLSVCLILSMSARSSCGGGGVATCTSCMLPHHLHHTLRGEAARVPPQKAKTLRIRHALKYVSNSHHEHTLAPAALAVFWRCCGNMRKAHVSTTSPKHLARRSRANSATKGRKR